MEWVKSLLKIFAESKAFYDRADQALQFELSKLMLEGPAEELTLTYHAQPALLTTGVMVAEKLRATGIQPHTTRGSFTWRIWCIGVSRCYVI